MTENIVNLPGMEIFGIFILIVGMMLIAYLRVRPFKEKQAKEPEKTVFATVLSKEVKEGTHDTGRSNYGYSYVIHFITGEGQKLELYAYEIEFGGLRKGMQGMLTYKGRYFVSFVQH